MADNIKLRKPNFATLDGYFFTFDEDQDALLQKTDDGNTAFSYPLDTVLTSTIQCTAYDGVHFWTLENKTDGRIIKSWEIDNYVCKLRNTFEFTNDTEHEYNVSTFSLEHYHTNLSTTASGGSTSIHIDEYSDEPDTIIDSKLHVGPNINGESEDVVVSGTIYGGVTLESPLNYEYSAGTEVNFHKYIWMFNNSNGLDTSTGSLYKFDSHTGDYIKKYPGGQYKDITASTFYKVPSFIEYGPVDTLAYVKGANMLFIDVSDNATIIADASDSNDDFDGSDGDSVDQDLWEVVSGDPIIQDNKLYTSTTNGTDKILSDYYLKDNFEVTISGALLSYDATYSGTEHFEHMFGVMFPNESDRYCYITRAANSEVGTVSGTQNFHVLSYKDTKALEYQVLATYSGSNNYDGEDLVNNYEFNISRSGDNVSFYYKKGMEEWDFMGTVQMFDSNCKLILGLNNTIDSTVTSTFDDLVYLSGETLRYKTATDLPFYGSMVLENIADDQITIIPVFDLVMDGDNVYRLQEKDDSGAGMSGYNYQLSPLSAFVTSISLSSTPAIIAANGLSTSDIEAYVKDQFLQPIPGRRVTFSEDGDGSLTGGTEINTDSDGKVQTEYTAGTTAQEITITAVVEQTN